MGVEVHDLPVRRTFGRDLVTPIDAVAVIIDVQDVVVPETGSAHGTGRAGVVSVTEFAEFGGYGVLENQVHGLRRGARQIDDLHA